MHSVSVKATFNLLDLASTILGMFDTLPYVNFGELKLEPNSMIVLYTDGLSEAANNEAQAV